MADELSSGAVAPNRARTSALENLRRKIRASLDDPRPSIPADEVFARLRAFHAEQVKAADDCPDLTSGV